MQHYDNVGITLERFAVARFLITPVPEILPVAKRLQAELARQRNCVVRTGVIDEQHRIDNFEWYLEDSLAECLLGIISRHDDHDFSSI
jgi:hypothetical protein